MRIQKRILVLGVVAMVLWLAAACAPASAPPTSLGAATPVQTLTSVPTATLPVTAAAPAPAPTSAATETAPVATATTAALTAPTAAATSAATSAAPVPPTETAAAATETVEPTEEPAQPSNAGGPGPAVNLTGNAANGATIYATSCQVCHGPQGKGGVPNPGSADGTVPPLNPIDDTIANKDPKTFATNVDLFIEHGSKPEGANPALQMPAWGDTKALSPQQIADVIAYIISLNPQ